MDSIQILRDALRASKLREHALSERASQQLERIETYHFNKWWNLAEYARSAYEQTVVQYRDQFEHSLALRDKLDQLITMKEGCDHDIPF